MKSFTQPLQLFLFSFLVALSSHAQNTSPKPFLDELFKTDWEGKAFFYDSDGKEIKMVPGYLTVSKDETKEDLYRIRTDIEEESGMETVSLPFQLINAEPFLDLSDVDAEFQITNLKTSSNSISFTLVEITTEPLRVKAEFKLYRKGERLIREDKAYLNDVLVGTRILDLSMAHGER